MGIEGREEGTTRLYITGSFCLAVENCAESRVTYSAACKWIKWNLQLYSKQTMFGLRLRCDCCTSNESWMPSWLTKLSSRETGVKLELQPGRWWFILVIQLSNSSHSSYLPKPIPMPFQSWMEIGGKRKTWSADGRERVEERRGRADSSDWRRPQAAAQRTGWHAGWGLLFRRRGALEQEFTNSIRRSEHKSIAFRRFRRLSLHIVTCAMHSAWIHHPREKG